MSSSSKSRFDEAASDREPLVSNMEHDIDDDIEDDVNPLLPESDLYLERIRNELQIDLAGADAYERQSIIINRAIEDIGMGRYQRELFILCGFGWFADNLWLQGLALSLPSLSTEFGLSETSVRYTTMILYFGMAFGSVGWGLLSDILGRRITFNSTLFITGFFGVLIALGPNWASTAFLFACMGLGVGGNLPVDGALFLEFLPRADNKLLTLLSAWWPAGQLAAAFTAWYFLPDNSCKANLQPCSMVGEGIPCCDSKDNRGWRYFIASLGAFTLFMFVCRFFLFKILESPKYLLSRNKQSEAVQVVQKIAHYNGTRTWLDENTLEQLAGEESSVPGLSLSRVGRKSIEKYSVTRVNALFATWKTGTATILLWIVWLTVGMAYPLFNAFLPQYLEHAGKGQEPVPADVVYRNYMIQSLAGVPGSFVAYYTVDMPRFGRKGTMAISTVITGLSLFLFTLSGNPAWQTFASAIQSLFSNVMYGVIYSYTAEVFPAPVRGTGSGIASLLNRIAGICAPLVAARAGLDDPMAPILAAGALYIVAFAAMCLLTIETRGAQTL